MLTTNCWPTQGVYSYLYFFFSVAFEAPLSGGKKGKPTRGKKRQRETKTPLKDKTPRKDANLQPVKVATLPKAVRENLLIELLQLQEQEHKNAQDDGVGLGNPPSPPKKKDTGDSASEDHVDGVPRNVLLDTESEPEDATSESEEDTPHSPNKGDDEMRQLLRQTLSELLKLSASPRRELANSPPPSALSGARPAAQSVTSPTSSTNLGTQIALHHPHTPNGIGNDLGGGPITQDGGTALQGGGTALGTSHGNPPPGNPFARKPCPPFHSEPWQRVPGDRTDSAAKKQWRRVNDAAKCAIWKGCPAPLQAWRTVSKETEMWNRLSQLSHSPDQILLNLGSSEPFKVAKRSRLPPKITNWKELWDAFDNRAATICTFFPQHAADTVTDRAVLVSLRDAGVSHTDAELWANSAIVQANAPCAALGQLDNETLVKLVAAARASPRKPAPQGDPSKQLRPSQGPRQSRHQDTPLTRLIFDKQAKFIKENNLCANYNMGICKKTPPHGTDRNPSLANVHKCCVCLQDHPVTKCPTSGLPSP